jgi:hypothetical protein
MTKNKKADAILNLTVEGKAVKVGRYWVRATHDELVENNRYSKKWHRQYGPYRSISNRRVEVSTTEGFKKIILTVEVSAYRVNWQKRVLEQLQQAPLNLAW